MITIRQEQKKDHAQVYALVREAFETAEHRDGTEQDLVERMRHSAAFVPSLSLVACDGGKLAGHILFTEIELGGTRALALAPLSVLPEYQRQGVGTRLMEAGHRIARALGYEWSVVVGSERYYPRAGYRPASQFGIYAPFEVPDQNHMVLALQGGSATFEHAVTHYAKEFFDT